MFYCYSLCPSPGFSNPSSISKPNKRIFSIVFVGNCNLILPIYNTLTTKMGIISIIKIFKSIKIQYSFVVKNLGSCKFYKIIKSMLFTIRLCRKNWISKEIFIIPLVFLDSRVWKNHGQSAVIINNNHLFSYYLALY